MLHQRNWAGFALIGVSPEASTRVMADNAPHIPSVLANFSQTT
jgi:hypothetical protein